MFVIRQIMAELPRLKAFIFHNNESVSAGDFDAQHCSRPGPGGAFNDTQGARFEKKRGDGHIFDFNTGMSSGSRKRCYFLYSTHKPLEKVDTVDSLIHQGASAIVPKRTSPPTRCIVLLGTIPLDINVRENDSSEATRADRVLQNLA